MSKTILCPECGLHDVEIEETINESMDKIIDSQKMDIYPNMSNSTQNDEIGKMEKAIDEGFAESERDLKDKKTPLDQPTQNDWAKDLDYIDFVTPEDMDRCVVLIRKLLADARREVIEKIEKIPHKEILIETKGGQVNCHNCKMLPKSPFCRHAQGWNDACRHILATLREEEGV